MSTESKDMEDTVADQDAIAQLIADHRRVSKLFAEFSNLADDGSDEEKATIVKQICDELAVHATLEEELFYPAVRKAISDDDLMDEALVEHASAKNLIAQLQAAGPDDDLYDAKVTVLGEQIDHHVEEEEGSMFPQARAAGVDTAALGAELLSRRAQILAGEPKSDATDDSPDSEEREIASASRARGAARASPRSKSKSTKKKR